MRVVNLFEVEVWGVEGVIELWIWLVILWCFVVVFDLFLFVEVLLVCGLIVLWDGDCWFWFGGNGVGSLLSFDLMIVLVECCLVLFFGG